MHENDRAAAFGLASGTSKMTKTKILSVLLLMIFVGSGMLWAQDVTAKPESLSKVETYDQLLAAIREARTASRVRVQQAKVRETWETGKLIDEHILNHKERADYGAKVIERLAKDLGTSATELRYSHIFAREYSTYPISDVLTWSDYRELLSLKDPEKREELSQKAEKEKWDTQRIRSEVKRINAVGRTGKEPDEPLTAQPGTPGTYRVLKATVGEFKGELVLDLGFSNYYKPAKIKKIKEGDIVQVERGKLKKNEAGPEALYTYQADVVEVVDGDTFKAVIRLGFGFNTVQKLRLRGLDAPEIETTDGQEAREFLVEKLMKTKTPVLIRTVKSDKYDRYLADVFISLPGGDLFYLNQALIEEGLAIRVQA